MTKKILYRQPDCYMGGCYQEKIAEDEEIPLKLIEYNAIEDKLSGYFCVVFNTKEDDDSDDFVKLVSTFKTNKCGGCSDNCKKPFILFLIEMKQNIPFMTMENYNEVCFSIEN